MGVEADQWGTDAAEHYQERLAVAAELGMDTAVGSEAEVIALREARRVAAGLPLSLWPCHRSPTALDHVLAAFPGAAFAGTVDDSSFDNTWIAPHGSVRCDAGS